MSTRTRAIRVVSELCTRMHILQECPNYADTRRILTHTVPRMQEIISWEHPRQSTLSQTSSAPQEPAARSEVWSNQINPPSLTAHIQSLISSSNSYFWHS